MLLERDYDEAADIWAVGCILAELLTVSQEYMSTQTRKRSDIVSSRRFFTSDSCFPLSPTQA